MFIIHATLAILCLYAFAGILFGAWFIVAGVAKLDSNALNAPVAFRILILPGAIVLWPVLALKLIAAARTTG